MTVRVVQMIDSLWTGGAEQMQLTYARASLARGIQPTIIMLRDYPGTVLPEHIRKSGARLLEFPGTGLVDPVRISRLARFLRRERVDVLHVHLSYAIIVGSMAALLAGVPVVATLHTAGASKRPRLEALMLRLAARRVIAVGPTVAEAYRQKLGNKPIEIVLNPVEKSTVPSEHEARCLRTELIGDPSRPLIVSAGRLQLEKGFEHLLQAMQILRETHPKAFLAIAGTGTLGDELESQIRRRGLDGHAKLLGLRDDVRSILAVADVYANSSLVEGLPIAVLEAMAAGRPVVATRVGDLPLVLNPDRGVLVSPGEPRELAQALGALLDDPAARAAMGERAREYVIQHHGSDAWFSQLLKIYEKAARGQTA